MEQSKTRRSLFFPTFILLVISALVIWIRTSTVKETYRFVQTERTLSSGKQEIQALRLKWTRLTAPQKLVSYARDLNLEPPRLDQIVKFSKLRTKSQ